jgi:glycosyltransferase involved in cell wall biosynthesis
MRHFENMISLSETRLNMPSISAVIITYNEQDHIENCISSLQDVADEIVVVDSFSTDATEAICTKFKVRFVKHSFEGYFEQKNYALSLASFPLILSLDGDEALSDELKKSILEVKNNKVFDGYRFNRRHNYCGKWLRFSRWYPDKQLRLFDRNKGYWTGPNPHDKIKLEHGAEIKFLKGDLLHWNYSSYEDHIEKINRFSTIAAGEYFRAGKSSGPLTATVHATWSFFRSYFLNAGFLDGYAGYICCSITAYASFLKYAKLRKLISDSRNQKNQV